MDDITLKKKLWDSLRDFKQQMQTWTATRFDELDDKDMEEQVANYYKVVMNAERSFLPTLLCQC